MIKYGVNLLKDAAGTAALNANGGGTARDVSLQTKWGLGHIISVPAIGTLHYFGDARPFESVAPDYASTVFGCFGQQGPVGQFYERGARETPQPDLNQAHPFGAVMSAPHHFMDSKPLNSDGPDFAFAGF